MASDKAFGIKVCSDIPGDCEEQQQPQRRLSLLRQESGARAEHPLNGSQVSPERKPAALRQKEPESQPIHVQRG